MSTSTTNWREVSGVTRIGAETKWPFRLENAASAALDPPNIILVEIKAVRGRPVGCNYEWNVCKNWQSPETSAGPFGHLGLANQPQPESCRDPCAPPQTRQWTPKTVPTVHETRIFPPWQKDHSQAASEALVWHTGYAPGKMKKKSICHPGKRVWTDRQCLLAHHWRVPGRPQGRWTGRKA